MLADSVEHSMVANEERNSLEVSLSDWIDNFLETLKRDALERKASEIAFDCKYEENRQSLQAIRNSLEELLTDCELMQSQLDRISEKVKVTTSHSEFIKASYDQLNKLFLNDLSQTQFTEVKALANSNNVEVDVVLDQFDELFSAHHRADKFEMDSAQCMQAPTQLSRNDV